MNNQPLAGWKRLALITFEGEFVIKKLETANEI